MIRSFMFVMAMMVVMISFISCSGSGEDATVPDLPRQQVSSKASHSLWGLYQFRADPSAQTLDFTQLRLGQFHLNVLPFLEPPPLLHLSLESLQFNGNIIEAGIGLRHPFLGLTEFTGFDVCGILISNGSYSGFNDTSILYAGPGDTYLMNPDGHSRWWNPREFPYNSTNNIFGYVDGLLGAPDSFADFNSTINGYKYFCDDLNGTNDPMSDVTLANRGMFSAGQKNVRTFVIELGPEGMVFNYAVDANWEFPNGDPPWTAPDDFSEDANRIEPWNISVIEDENSLYYADGAGGGELRLSIDVYDWFNADMNSLYIEAAGVIPQVGPITPFSGGPGYSTYAVDITDASPISSSEIELLITIETEQSDFQGFIPGTNTSAYFQYTAEVSDEAPILIDCGTMLSIQSSGHWESTWYQSTNFRSGLTITRSGAPYLIGRRRYINGTWTDAANGIHARAQTNTGQMHDYEVIFPTGTNPHSNMVSDSQNLIYFALNIDTSQVRTIPFSPATGFGTHAAFQSLPSGWVINLMATDADDNIIVLGSNSGSRRVFHHNGSGWDETDVPSELTTGKSILDFAYNPILDHYVFTCWVTAGASSVCDLYAVDTSGNIAHSELDIFSDFTYSEIYRPWLCIDPDDPECHLVVWGGFQPTGFPTQNGYRPVYRYDAAYGGKTIGQTSFDNYDAPWGKGAFCPGTDRLYTGNSIWTIFLTWFNLPSDW